MGPGHSVLHVSTPSDDQDDSFGEGEEKGRSNT